MRMTAHFIWTLSAFLLIFLAPTEATRVQHARWRAATEQELKAIIPARAPVVKESIETEFSTASGVTDGHGRFIAGVVMITAGYSAEGKYSHFFITQARLRIGDIVLEPGEYVFGYRRKSDETISVSFYRASTGVMIGESEAYINHRSSLVRSLLIGPPVAGKASIRIGRYLLDYRVD